MQKLTSAYAATQSYGRLHIRTCSRCQHMRLAITTLKGGTGKTTTAVHLAAGLGRQGRTLLIDADPQESATEWAALMGDECPFTCVTDAGDDLHRRLGERTRGYDH